MEADGIFKAHLERALQNPTALAHLGAAELELLRKFHKSAVREVDRALELSPNDADVLVHAARILTMSGQPERAEPLVRRAMRLDPHFPQHFVDILALVRYARGDAAEVVTFLSRDYSNKKTDLQSVPVLAAALVEVGRVEDARAVQQNYMGFSDSISISLSTPR